MKKLIVSGDSCTEKFFYSVVHPEMDFDYPKWPDHIGKHLGMEVVNLARGGAGNKFIHSSIQDAVMEIPNEEIGLVIAGWTQAHREDWELGKRDHYPYKGFTLSPWRSRRVRKDGSLYGWVRKSLRTYIDFQNLCENNNLPYYHFQMGDIFENYIDGLEQTETEAKSGIKYKKRYEGDQLEDLQSILNLLARYDPHIKNFMGWPGITKDLQKNIELFKSDSIPFNLKGAATANINWPLSQRGEMIGTFSPSSSDDKGSYTMHSHILGHNLEDRMNRDLTISVEDDHPNEKGHKAIADFIIRNLKL